MAELEAIQTAVTQVAIPGSHSSNDGKERGSCWAHIRHKNSQFRRGMWTKAQETSFEATLLQLECSREEKYVELLSFEMEVISILQSKAYEVTEEEKFPMIKNWLGREALQLIQTFMNSEKEACKTVEGLFCMLSEKFNPHSN